MTNLYTMWLYHKYTTTFPTTDRQTDRQKGMGREMKGGLEKEKEVWRQRRGTAFWLRFRRDSIYNNEFVKNGLM